MYASGSARARLCETEEVDAAGAKCRSTNQSGCKPEYYSCLELYSVLESTTKYSTNLDRRPTDNAGPVGTKAEAVAAVASAITHEAFMLIEDVLGRGVRVVALRGGLWDALS